MITISRTEDLARMRRVDNLAGVAFTQEQGGHKFIITTVRNGAPEAVTGSVTARFMRSDGESVQLTSGYCGISDGKAVVTLAANCYLYPGIFKMVVFNVEGDDPTDENANRTVIYACAGYILPSQNGSVVDPENIINLDAVAALIGDMEDAVDDAEAAAAAARSADTKIGILINGGREMTPAYTLTEGAYIKYSNGKATSSTAYKYTDYIDVSGVKAVRYSRVKTTGSSDYYGMAFYSTAAESGYIEDSGVKSLKNQEAAGYTDNTVAVPAGAKYARFSVFADAQYGTFSVTGLMENGLADAVESIEKKVPLPVAETGSRTGGKGINYTTGSPATSAAYDSTDYIDVGDYTKITYTRVTITGGTSSMGMAFYDASKVFIEDSGIQNRTSSDAAGFEMHTAAVPEGAKYARFSWWSDAYKEQYGITQDFELYDSAVYAGCLQDQIDELKARKTGDPYNALGLHTLPANEGVANVIRRARQMTDILWTPAVDLPRAMMVTLTNPDSGTQEEYEGVFKAGVTYRGLPYGNCTGYKPAYGKANTYVGYNGVGFGAFVTSVGNGDSMVAKESAHSVNPHRSLVYAAVCSSLVCYALNVDFKETSHIQNIHGMSSIGKIIDNGARMDIDANLRLGDVLNLSGYHVSLVTDIVRNASDEIEYIEISEATVVGNGNQAQAQAGGPLGGVCRRLAFTVEDFFWRYGAYTLLRYGSISSVPYTKSPWVDVGDEIPMNPLAQLPCMPYEGEGFEYIEGHIPYTRILVSCHDYAYMRVFKDGSEFTGSPFAVGANDEYVTVGFSAAGEYSAYLCNMSGGSDTALTARCHWSVVEDESEESEGE